MVSAVILLQSCATSKCARAESSKCSQVRLSPLQKQTPKPDDLVNVGKGFKSPIRAEIAAGQIKPGYTDRDVDLTPSKKLRSDLHSAEVAGIPTLIGIDNVARLPSALKEPLLSPRLLGRARLKRAAKSASAPKPWKRGCTARRASAGASGKGG